jgi:hypothetical protein
MFLIAQQPTEIVYWFNQGFAVLLVITLGWAIYRWLCWAGVNLLVPAKDAAVEHLKETTATMKQVKDTLADQHGAILQIKTQVEELDLKTTRVVDAVARCRQTG